MARSDKTKKNNTKKEDNDEKMKSKENVKKGAIPLQLIPNESDEVAEEMQKIFDEDKVVHRHGSSEPESD